MLSSYWHSALSTNAIEETIFPYTFIPLAFGGMRAVAGSLNRCRHKCCTYADARKFLRTSAVASFQPKALARCSQLPSHQGSWSLRAAAPRWYTGKSFLRSQKLSRGKLQLSYLHTTPCLPPEEAASTTANKPKKAKPLVLLSGAFDLPHPEKAYKGGEDSYFIADSLVSVGVADGVGGWAELGIDAGAYARTLMNNARTAAEAADEHEQGVCPQEILEKAYDGTAVQGSSTACIVCLRDDVLHVSNLGDSGFVLVRNGKIEFQSPQQQHGFNFPFQLGCAGSQSDHPNVAMRFEVPVQPGDIIVVGTDGLFDNVFSDEIATIVTQVKDRNQPAAVAAKILCQYARFRAADKQYPSPFAYSAFQAGFPYLGGKMDDITVLVSIVSVPSKL